MRKAFTLLEMILSISILSITMLFLYESYSSLNSSNTFYKQKLDTLKIDQLKKRVIFLDFTLAFEKSINILNQGTKEDVVFFQSSNSIYKKYNPYIAYITKENKLYRLESLKEFKTYPLDMDVDFTAECLGTVNSFRVYEPLNKEKGVLLLHIDFKEDEDVLLKIKVLNSYS